MARPALTDEQRRETRRKIRGAAAALYAESGLQDISARKIAQQAGVSVGTLYSYFDNLTELMQSLWKEPVRRLIRELESELAGIDDPLKRVRAFLSGYAQFALNEPATYRGSFLFVRPDNQPKPDQTALENDRFFRLLTDSVERAQATGQARSGDPQAIAQLLWSGLHGAIALPNNMDRLALAAPADSVAPMIDALMGWLAESH